MSLKATVDCFVTFDAVLTVETDGDRHSFFCFNILTTDKGVASVVRDIQIRAAFIASFLYVWGRTLFLRLSMTVHLSVSDIVSQSE
jgi:hypothetical protein